MGRKGKWFSSVKKALSPESKEKKDQKSSKSKKKWFGKQQPQYVDSTLENDRAVSPPPLPEELKLIETENVQNIHSYSPPVADVAAAEPTIPVVQSTHEVAQVARPNKFPGKSAEEASAIMIQTAFRGYLARRALRALRGLVRLKSLMEGPTVKRQATHTLRCMQTLARVQAQIHTRRMKMSEENQALQRQLLQKHAKELETLRMGDAWDDSLQSKEQIETSLLNKYEAALRRERAMAYSFSHQKTSKNPSRSAPRMFMNAGNPSWGWSWLERWMAAHPWDNRTEKEQNQQTSTKSASRSIAGEISRSYARYQLNSDKLSSPRENDKSSQQSPSTPSKPVSAVVARKLKSASPRSSSVVPDDDARSMTSMQSDRHRRHSIGVSSSVRDDESLGSSASVPSYMVPTESARAKSRLQSPLSGMEKNGTPEKEKSPLASAKKRLSYSPSPAKPRRHSGPPKVETNLITESCLVVGDSI